MFYTTKSLGYVNKYNRGIGQVQKELSQNGNPEAKFDVSLLTAFAVEVKKCTSQKGKTATSQATTATSQKDQTATSQNRKGHKSKLKRVPVSHKSATSRVPVSHKLYNLRWCMI